MKNLCDESVLGLTVHISQCSLLSLENWGIVEALGMTFIGLILLLFILYALFGGDTHKSKSPY